MPEQDYRYVQVQNRGGETWLTTRSDSNVTTTRTIADTELDFQGRKIDACWVDDLDQYTLLVDEETWIGELYVQPHQQPQLTEQEQELFNRIYDRPLFPVQKRDGCVFTYDALKRDFVMSHHHPVFMNLVQKDAILPVDDEFYAARTSFYDR